MNIEQLQFFIMIEKLNSFSEAANELYISQSTLSKQIKMLEKQLGFSLFERTTRKIKITRAGEIFSKHAHNIVSEYHAMKLETDKYQQDFSVINIAAIPILEAYNFTKLLDDFQNDHPNILLAVEEIDRPTVMNELQRGLVDIAIVRSTLINDSGLNAIQLLEEELVLVVSVDHPLADRNEISLAEASNESFYFLGKHTGIYTYCIEECAKVGFFPNVSRSEYNRRSIKSKIKGCKGISLLANGIADEIFDTDLRIIRLKEHPTIDISIVMKNERISDDCQLLIDYIKRAFD